MAGGPRSLGVETAVAVVVPDWAARAARVARSASAEMAAINWVVGAEVEPAVAQPVVWAVVAAAAEAVPPAAPGADQAAWVAWAAAAAVVAHIIRLVLAVGPVGQAGAR